MTMRIWLHAGMAIFSVVAAEARADDDKRLNDGLNSPDAAVRRKTLRQMREDRPYDEGLFALFGRTLQADPSADVRAEAAILIGDVAARDIFNGLKDCRPFLVPGLQDPDPTVRASAMNAIARANVRILDSGELIRRIADAGREKGLRDDAIAILTAGAVSARRAAIPLIALRLCETDDGTELHWVSHLAFITRPGDPARTSALGFLLAALTQKAGDKRLTALNLLPHIPELARMIVPQIVARFDDSDPACRAAAMNALAQACPDDPATVPSLMRVLDGPHAAMRADAIRSLGILGAKAKPAVAKLTAILDESEDGPNEGPQAMAVWALGRIGPDAAAAARRLREGLDSHVVTRKRAPYRIALARIERDPVHVAEMIGWTRNDRPDKLNRPVAEALAAIGPKGREAIPRLLELLQYDATRIDALLALHGIDPDHPKIIENLRPALLDDNPHEALRLLAGPLRGKVGVLKKEIAGALRKTHVRAFFDADPLVFPLMDELLAK